ncbi:MAG TPA: hypothetical protein VGQ73_05530 [Gemmatimonadales bacterium]|jgi:hypothetical protein|nr:hypothetical protein [Gemmatimonadales bacterium]
MLGIVLGVLAIALAYAGAFLPAPIPRLAPWLMAIGLTLFLLSLLLLGTRRRGRKTPALLLLGFAFTGLVLFGGFGAALALPPEHAGSPLLLGLPRRAALLLYGIGLLPALVLPLLYARSFEAVVLSDAELAEWRARLAQLESERQPE